MFNFLKSNKDKSLKKRGFALCETTYIEVDDDDDWNNYGISYTDNEGKTYNISFKDLYDTVNWWKENKKETN